MPGLQGTVAAMPRSCRDAGTDKLFFVTKSSDLSNCCAMKTSSQYCAKLLYSHPWNELRFLRLRESSLFRTETIWNDWLIHRNGCGIIAAPLVRTICWQVQEHFLSPGSSTHALKHPPVVPVAAGGITMSQAPLVAAPTWQVVLCGCAHDSVSPPGTNHVMCPGGLELLLNTMCNVGSRLRGLP